MRFLVWLVWQLPRPASSCWPKAKSSVGTIAGCTDSSDQIQSCWLFYRSLVM